MTDRRGARAVRSFGADPAAGAIPELVEEETPQRAHQIGFVAVLVRSSLTAVTEAEDCNSNGVPDGNGVGDVCEPPPAGAPAGDCCGGGADSAMMLSATLLGLGWTRRRRTRARW
ncbi:MAG: hypothetical protein ACE5E1_10770 [Phycisphaerae bacterium]